MSFFHPANREEVEHTSSYGLQFGTTGKSQQINARAHRQGKPGGPETA